MPSRHLSPPWIFSGTAFLIVGESHAVHSYYPDLDWGESPPILHLHWLFVVSFMVFPKPPTRCFFYSGETQTHPTFHWVVFKREMITPGVPQSSPGFLRTSQAAVPWPVRALVALCWCLTYFMFCYFSPKSQTFPRFEHPNLFLF